MKPKKLLILVLALLCCSFALGAAALAEEEPVYTKVTSLEGNITVSSTLNNPTGENLTWELSKLANSGRGAWTAQWGWTSNPSADEWIRIDLTESKTIGRIVLHNESGNSFARKFVVFGSEDGASWYELARYENGDEGWADDNAVTLDFPAASARYLQISLREKGQNGTNYLLSMSEIEVFETDQPASAELRPYTEAAVTVTADETLDGGASIDVLTDGVSADQTSNTSYWSGGWKTGSASDTDELIFDAGQVISFGGISLFPRCATTSSAEPCVTYGFPEAFAIYASADGQTWDLLPRQTYDDYAAELSWNDFFFVKPVQARYIKFAVTGRSEAGGAYLTQLAEVKAWRADFEDQTNYTLITPQSAEASGSWTGDTGPEKAYDGNYGTSWVATWRYSTHIYADEHITYDLGETAIIGRVDLHVDSVNVPASIRVLAGTDGENFGVLFREDDPQYTDNCLSVTFDSVEARYVRVEIFKKGPNGDNYLGGFTEIEVYRTDEAEALSELEILNDITSAADISVSSVTDPNTADKLTDGITANTNAQSNYWMSGISAEATVDGSGTELGFDGLSFSFAEQTAVDEIWLFPRFDGVPGHVIGFPVSFTFLYSQNGQEWYEIASYSDYQVKAGWNEFAFPGRVNASYIGLLVQTRGMNGELYTVELAEVKLFRAAGERAAMEQGALTVDTSSISVTPYEPEGTVYTYEEFRLKLSDYFSYSLPAELTFEVRKGGGEIEIVDGEAWYVYTPEVSGSEDIRIRARPTGKTDPTARLDFTLTISTKDDPDVIARPWSTDMHYAAGVTFRLDLEQLFVYEGTADLVYTADVGAIEEVGDKTYLVFTPAEPGETVLTVTATVEGREDKTASNTVTVTAVAAPEAEPEQPPVYGPVKSSCVSSLGGSSLFAAAAALAAGLIAIRRKRV